MIPNPTTKEYSDAILRARAERIAHRIASSRPNENTNLRNYYHLPPLSYPKPEDSMVRWRREAKCKPSEGPIRQCEVDLPKHVKANRSPKRLRAHLRDWRKSIGLQCKEFASKNIIVTR